MNTRREFIKNSILGTLSLATFVPGKSVLAKALDFTSEPQKEIRIGIVGAENTHSFRLGQLFNVKKQFPGCRVDYLWGKTASIAKESAQKGSIPNIVQKPTDMLGKIDAVIICNRNADEHLASAMPFVKAGIPTFVDKPFCYRVEEGKKFLKFAKQVGTPVTSYSSITMRDETEDLREQVTRIKDIEQVVFVGPADIYSPYGGIFFYGIHAIEPLMYIFNDRIKKVRVIPAEKNATAQVVFTSGLLATLVFTNAKGKSLTVVDEFGPKILTSRVKESEPQKSYSKMVEMFRTGKEPRSYEDVLAPIAVLEAMEKSVKDGQWQQVHY